MFRSLLEPFSSHLDVKSPTTVKLDLNVHFLFILYTSVYNLLSKEKIQSKLETGKKIVNFLNSKSQIIIKYIEFFFKLIIKLFLKLSFLIF